jgi:GNAT superfamily N-acetyltransferase
MVELMVTYMEMTAPPSSPLRPTPVAGVSVARPRLGRPDYLTLYRAVGEPLQWDLRLRMEPQALDRLLADPSTHVHVLRQDAEAIGFCEFNGVGKPEVELVYFGLVPAAQGKGLGPFLLDRALRDCWGNGPDRIWLHTDTQDHPNAVAVYAKAGFRPYLRRMESFAD